MKMKMKMKMEDLIHSLSITHKAELSALIVGNKVLPISDSTTSTSSSSSSSVPTSNIDDQDKCRPCDRKQDKVKGNSNKDKALCRLKELMRWAAAIKAEKGGKLSRKVSHFRNKSATIKSGGFDEQSNDSPKISFRWEVESCSTTCSAASAPPSLKYDKCSSKRGSWITTDDDFVVLEL